MDTQPFIETNRELRQRFILLLDALSGLQALTSMDGHIGSEEQMVQQALEVLLANQDLERCSVYLLRGDRIECISGYDWEEKLGPTAGLPKPHSFALGEGLIGQVALTGELIECQDCMRDERYQPLEDGANPGSLICVPLISTDRILGVLNVSHPQTHFFHPWHRNILALFSNVLAQMLGQHRLMHQMEQQVHERTWQLEQALSTTEDLKRRYEELSVIDDLTRLHNRRFFFPEAIAELSRSLRNRQHFSVTLIDLDLFKQINDNHGHAIGDEVLKGVAGVLTELTREGDILARFGGEEFVIALPHTDLEGARLLGERIRMAVADLCWTNDSEMGITLSMGISSLAQVEDALLEKPHHQEILDQMLKQADRALYYAKEHGRDQVVLFTDIPAPS